VEKNMNFKLVHNNLNVFDLEKSLKFYEEALGLKEVRRKQASDGSFILVFIANENSEHQIELTWLRDRKEPIILATMKSTSHSEWTTMKEPIRNTRKWVASVMKTRTWGSISSTIPMDTGSRLYLTGRLSHIELIPTFPGMGSLL
jgi:catalase